MKNIRKILAEEGLTQKTAVSRKMRSFLTKLKKSKEIASVIKPIPDRRFRPGRGNAGGLDFTASRNYVVLYFIPQRSARDVQKAVENLVAAAGGDFPETITRYQLLDDGPPDLGDRWWTHHLLVYFE